MLPLAVRFTGLGRLAVRRLLQLDVEVPPRSDAEAAAFMLHHYRWNFTVNVLDGVFFWLGLSFISASTILPLFVSKLTTNPLLIALVAVIAQAGWYVPQVFTAAATERVASKKAIVVNLGLLLERVPMLLLPLAALIGPTSPMLALLLFFVAYAWHGLGAGMVAPAWQDLVARCFPVNRRGLFFGLSAFLGTGVGAAGAGFSSWLLQAFPYPTNFVLTFAIAAAAINLSWIFLAMTREPVQPVPVEALTRREGAWGKVGRIVRQDQNFRRFLLTRILASLGTMGMGFITVAALQRWQVPDSTVAWYTAASLVGQTVGNLLAGLLADRFGHKISLELGQWTAVGAFGVAWLAPSPGWYFLAFGLLGASTGIRIISGVLIALEFSTPADRPTYVGIASTALGLSSGLAPLLGGLIAIFSYGWLFAASTGFSLLAALVLMVAVREPRGLPPAPPV